jgi:serine/threonine protein kinase
MSDQKLRPDPLELLGKQLLARYTVRERLASGGMSVVYRGQDERLQRPVCVKVFFGIDREQVEYQTNYEHFVQEAFALSQLQHPNTLRIYDFGYLDEAPHSPFYVSELMAGGTLKNHVRSAGKLDPRGALELMEPIVHALAEAHARGIIHRDIKPSNILFGAAGARKIVKLADFGIAKAHIDGDKPLIPNRASDTQAVPGYKILLYSPGWAAPEQMKGKPVGPTADVYALGLVLAFMLTGKKVFSDDNVLESLSHRIEGDSYIAKEVAKMGLPQAVADVILTACKNDPPARHPTADHFLVALTEAVHLEPRALVTSIAAEPPVTAPMPFDPGPEAKTQPDSPSAHGHASRSPKPKPVTEISPAVLVLASFTDHEVVAAGRRVHLLPTKEFIDIGGEDDKLVPSKARVRVTFLPTPIGKSARIHIKGLNCFVAKGGGRASSATDLSEDSDLEMKLPGTERLDAVRCRFGVLGDGGVRVFPVANVSLGVPLAQASHSVLLDFGPGRELVLVYSIR